MHFIAYGIQNGHNKCSQIDIGMARKHIRFPQGTDGQREKNTVFDDVKRFEKKKVDQRLLGNLNTRPIGEDINNSHPYKHG